MKTVSGILLSSSVILFFLVIFIGCETSELKSTWCDRTITIDGVDSGPEWENARYFFEKEKVTLGVMNTENTLYLRLSTYDPRLQRQFMALGLTIWFDEKGGERKVMGIHYPLRGQGGEMPRMRRNDLANTAGVVDTLVQTISDEIELIGPGKGERTPLSPVEAGKYGIFYKIGDTKGNLVYELQIPLQRTDACPYGISAKLTKAVGIDFEEGKMNSSQMGQRRGGGEGRGGIGGGGRGGMGGGGMGGMGRRGGMGGGGMGAPVQETLDLKVKVYLAGPADPPSKS
jgi:hypothetical protein